MTGVHEIGLWRRRIGHLPLQTARRGQIRQQVSTQNAHNGVLLDTYQPRGRRELPFRWGQHRLPLRESAAPAEDNRLGVPERRHLPLGHRRRTIRFPAAAAGRYASSAERLARVRSCQVRVGAGSYHSCRQRALRVEPSKARTRRSLVTDGRKPGGGAKPCPVLRHPRPNRGSRCPTDRYPPNRPPAPYNCTPPPPNRPLGANTPTGVHTERAQRRFAGHLSPRSSECGIEIYELCLQVIASESFI